MTSLWLHPHNLVLASQSAIRRHILDALALPHVCVKADIDERLVEAECSSADIAGHLAAAKAKAVARHWPGHLILGADQTLNLGNDILHKPHDMAQALEHLVRLSGKTHELRSGVALVLDDKVLFQTTDIARLKMRSFSRDYAKTYLDALGEAVLTTVGGYQIEGLGPHLFEKVEGDHFTILGLPVYPVLEFFRRSGFLS